MAAMPATPKGRKLTYDDYLGFPEDRHRHEILDGAELVKAAEFWADRGDVVTSPVLPGFEVPAAELVPLPPDLSA